MEKERETADSEAVAEELDAARAAGYQTALCIRPGNHPAPEHDHPVIESFEEIEVA